MPHEHPTPSQLAPSDEMRKGFNLLLLFSSMHAMPLNAMFRKAGKCGHRFFGVHAIWALIYIPFFCAFTAQHGSRGFPILIFLLIYLVTLFRHRMKALRLMREGAPPVHSCYVGESAITCFPQCATEESRRGVAEPLFTLLLSVSLLVLGPIAFPIAAYLFVGAICLVFNETLMIHSFEAQTQAMIDAAWDNQYLAQRFRDRTGRN